MKKVKRVATLVLCLCMFFSIAACKDDPGPGPDPGSDQTVTISQSTLSLDRYAEAQLTAQADPAGTITWSSSDTAVCEVTDGLVVATGTGTAEVTASCGDGSASCTVTVGDSGAVPEIESGRQSIDVVRGETLSAVFTVSYKSQPISGVSFTYKVEDTSVATVDASGTVTGVKVGSTMLTASAAYKGLELSRSVPVNVKSDVEVTLSQSAVQLYTSQPEGTDYATSCTLTASVSKAGEPIGGATVAWSLSEGDAVTVEDGVVTAVKTGTARVRATYNDSTDGEIYAEAVITVDLPRITTDTVFSVDRMHDATRLLDTAEYPAATEVIYLEEVITDNADGALTLKQSWLDSVSNGEFAVMVLSDGVLYEATLIIYNGYAPVGLSSFAVGSDAYSEITWTPADTSDADVQAIVGDREGVYHFNYDGPEHNSWYVRVENMNMETWRANYGYIQYNIYLEEKMPAGSGIANYVGSTAFGLYQTSDITAPGFTVLDANGNRISRMVTGEWLTVIIDIDATGSSGARFSFSGAGTGAGGTYFYVSDFRLIEEEHYSTLRIESNVSSISIPTVTTAIDPVTVSVFEGTTQLEDPNLVWASSNEAVVKVTGNGGSATLQCLAQGIAYITATYTNRLGETAVATIAFECEKLDAYYKEVPAPTLTAEGVDVSPDYLDISDYSDYLTDTTDFPAEGAPAGITSAVHLSDISNIYNAGYNQFRIALEGINFDDYVENAAGVTQGMTSDTWGFTDQVRYGNDYISVWMYWKTVYADGREETPATHDVWGQVWWADGSYNRITEAGYYTCQSIVTDQVDANGNMINGRGHTNVWFEYRIPMNLIKNAADVRDEMFFTMYYDRMWSSGAEVLTDVYIAMPTVVYGLEDGAVGEDVDLSLDNRGLTDLTYNITVTDASGATVFTGSETNAVLNLSEGGDYTVTYSDVVSSAYKNASTFSKKLTLIGDGSDVPPAPEEEAYYEAPVLTPEGIKWASGEAVSAQSPKIELTTDFPQEGAPAGIASAIHMSGINEVVTDMQTSKMIAFTLGDINFADYSANSNPDALGKSTSASWLMTDQIGTGNDYISVWMYVSAIYRDGSEGVPARRPNIWGQAWFVDGNGARVSSIYSLNDTSTNVFDANGNEIDGRIITNGGWFEYRIPILAVKELAASYNELYFTGYFNGMTDDGTEVITDIYFAMPSIQLSVRGAANAAVDLSIDDREISDLTYTITVTDTAGDVVFSGSESEATLAASALVAGEYTVTYTEIASPSVYKNTSSFTKKLILSAAQG